MSAPSQNASRNVPFVEAKSNGDAVPCLSVVMPVFNEEASVATVPCNVMAQRPVQELVVVDDCSGDRTFEEGEKINRRGGFGALRRIVKHTFFQ
jgi:hypothetical protein